MEAQMKALVSKSSRVMWTSINPTNTRNLSFSLKVTEFADLQNSEFVSQHRGYKPSNVWSGLKHLGIHECVGQPLLDAVDWTTKGPMKPVKNQVSCGSFWAFSEEWYRCDTRSQRDH